MRSIVLYALTIALTFAPAYGQTVFELVKASGEGDLRPAHKAQALTVLEQVRTSPERGLFPEGLPAAESRLPDGASAETGTDFTVRGSGGGDVNLPYPLTDGVWTATLSTTSTHHSFWLDNAPDEPYNTENLFCTASVCSVQVGYSRTRQWFLVSGSRNMSIRPHIAADDDWVIRFVKDGSTPSFVAASNLPEVVSAETETDFTARGSGGTVGGENVNLPYPLTAGIWTATLSTANNTQHTFVLDSNEPYNSERVFCSVLACQVQVGNSRTANRLLVSGSIDMSIWVRMDADDAWVIRFVKESSTPSPDPDPSPGPCTPTTDVLQFDGGYGVRMCYVTGEGETGQAQAGVWASSQSGILWFFSRENAEVLVKVLDGCEYNGHRWVFVAPVTDVGFELRVTAPDGETWTHTNTAGTTASTRSDTSAFRCR